MRKLTGKERDDLIKFVLGVLYVFLWSLGVFILSTLDFIRRLF